MELSQLPPSDQSLTESLLGRYKSWLTHRVNEWVQKDRLLIARGEKSAALRVTQDVSFALPFPVDAFCQAKPLFLLFLQLSLRSPE